MGAMVIDICEAVKDAINAAITAEELTETGVTATRDWEPFDSLEELNNSLAISVVPKEIDITQASRTQGPDAHSYDIDIGIREMVTQASKADRKARLDELALFTQSVCDMIRKKSITASGKEMSSQVIQNSPIYDVEALKENSVYFSLITVGYQVMRSPS